VAVPSGDPTHPPQPAELVTAALVTADPPPKRTTEPPTSTTSPGTVTGPNDHVAKPRRSRSSRYKVKYVDNGYDAWSAAQEACRLIGASPELN
jgi:hypothetical protein